MNTKTAEQALLNRILYVGEEIPVDFTVDSRPKFMVLGTPQEFLDEVTLLKE